MNLDEINLQAEELEDLQETEESVLFGLEKMIGNAHNKYLLNQLTQSPFFDRAARLLHNDFADHLNNHFNGRSSGQKNLQKIFEDFAGLLDNSPHQQLAVYAEEPTILNRLSKYVKILRSDLTNQYAGV